VWRVELYIVLQILKQEVDTELGTVERLKEPE
jgi:hypothetical protein